jgi:TusA-related sulfurtransferase
MKEIGTGEIEVIVDNETSRENVNRAAGSQGWEITSVRKESDEYHLILRRE